MSKHLSLANAVPEHLQQALVGVSQKNQQKEVPQIEQYAEFSSEIKTHQDQKDNMQPDSEQNPSFYPCKNETKTNVEK